MQPTVSIRWSSWPESVLFPEEDETSDDNRGDDTRECQTNTDSCKDRGCIVKRDNRNDDDDEQIVCLMQNYLW